MQPRRMIVRTSIAGAQCVTLSEAKAWARIDSDDEDAFISQLIDTATELTEMYIRKSLINQTFRLSLDLRTIEEYEDLGEGSYDLPVTALYQALPTTIGLLRGPVSSITSVITYDLDNNPTTMDSGDYRLDSDGSRLILNDGVSWPTNLRPKAAVEITYVGGYGSDPTDVPQAIKNAIMIFVTALYESRGLCEDIPSMAQQILTPFKLVGSV